MSKIKIKNFGPIKEGYTENDGWMDIEKVTVFIGNQGSGKSTVAKLISTFTWIEKALTRGDYDIRWFSRKNKLKNQFLTYHRIENYLVSLSNKIITEINYVGDAYRIDYINGDLEIMEILNGGYPLPQIMYVPAERNFIANVKKPKALNLTSDSLIDFVTEFDSAKNEMKGSMRLPINDADIEFNKLNDIVYIKTKDYKIKLTEASSGFQSLVPLYLVSWFLSNSVKGQSENSKELMTSEQRERFRKKMQELLYKNTALTQDQIRIAISEEAKRFNKTAFINIVEEPEQNLFPLSQKEMLFSLLQFNNLTPANKLILTTHSPYIINYLTLAVKADSLKREVQSEELSNKLKNIVPFDATVDPNDLIIYELDEKDGTIKKLEDYKGLPSDENQLNERLGESNELFARLLEIQQGI